MVQELSMGGARAVQTVPARVRPLKNVRLLLESEFVNPTARPPDNRSALFVRPQGKLSQDKDLEGSRVIEADAVS
jgi:hypothetical protein